jgi:hypothetical protein
MKVLCALLSLFFFIRVNSLDIAESSLRGMPLETLLGSLVQEGELKGIYSNSQISFFFKQIENYYPELVD